MDLSWIVPPLLGGILIGVAATVNLMGNGRVAGISGILAGTMRPGAEDKPERWAFLVGLLVTGLVGVAAYPTAFAGGIDRSFPAVALAGLLVGFGTQLGNGCTSGHGVCGISRRSPRSLAATATFMATGGLAAFAVGHLLGGRV